MTFSEWVLINGDNLQFVLFFAALLVLAVAERFAPRRLGPMDRRVRWPTNYLLTFVNILALRRSRSRSSAPRPGRRRTAGVS